MANENQLNLTEAEALDIQQKMHGLMDRIGVVARIEGKMQAQAWYEALQEKAGKQPARDALIINYLKTPAAKEDLKTYEELYHAQIADPDNTLKKDALEKQELVLEQHALRAAEVNFSAGANDALMERLKETFNDGKGNDSGKLRALGLRENLGVATALVFVEKAEKDTRERLHDQDKDLDDRAKGVKDPNNKWRAGVDKYKPEFLRQFEEGQAADTEQKKTDAKAQKQSFEPSTSPTNKPAIVADASAHVEDGATLTPLRTPLAKAATPSPGLAASGKRSMG